MKELKIISKGIDEIYPYENNPRHNEEAIAYVANSIKEFGFKVPIIIDENNVIVAGDTRYKAAKLLEYSEVPCICADDLTPDQAKAFRLADNKVAEISYWDMDKLEEELSELSNIEMSMFNFDSSEFDNIDLDSLFEPKESTEDKEKKLVTCPHCGKPIEV